MGEALYRKYRPRKLADVVGQPHITSTIESALKQNRISHGYLFSGPRGVGKTSVARILAHEINQFSYGDEQGSLDIIEIDAASNRRIDEIRDLRDKVHTAPIAGKYKVYIIDEVHMLTREAFNALLKTLEEPPAHAVFVLATTEAHKLPETIISRTQHFTFRPVSNETIAAHLKTIADQESLSISPEALQLIAEHGRGSFRDSISSLDQLSILDKVETNDVLQLLGIPPHALVTNLYEYINSADLPKLVDAIEQAETDGYDAVELSRALLRHVRSILVEKPSLQLVNLSQKLLTVSSSPNPSVALQLTLIEFAIQNTPTIAVQPPKQVEVKPVKAEPAQSSKPKIEKPKVQPSKEATTQKKPADIKPVAVENLWNAVLDKLKSKYNTLYGVARMAEAIQSDSELLIKVPFQFHYKKLSDEKNSKLLSGIANDINGRPITVKLEIDPSVKSSPQKKPVDSPAQPDTLAVVTQIFGGGEILET